MARPRKYSERMSRSLGLRLPDAQYDWLIDRAVGFDGDLSEATRDAIDAARLLYEIISAGDPHARLQRLLEESEQEAAQDAFREAYHDEHGEYPPE
jgi:hypothetical protein